MHSVALNQRLIFFKHFFHVVWICVRTVVSKGCALFCFQHQQSYQGNQIICDHLSGFSHFASTRHSWRDALMPSLGCCRTAGLQLGLGRLLNIVNAISLCLSWCYLTTRRWIVITIMVHGSATFSDVDADKYRSFLLAPSGREQYWSQVFYLSCRIGQAEVKYLV